MFAPPPVGRAAAAGSIIAQIEPVLETLPGWEEETVGTETYEDLPANARAYIEFIERQVGAPAAVVSTGPRREETIVREHRLLGA